MTSFFRELSHLCSNNSINRKPPQVKWKPMFTLHLHWFVHHLLLPNFGWECQPKSWPPSSPPAVQFQGQFSNILNIRPQTWSHQLEVFSWWCRWIIFSLRERVLRSPNQRRSFSLSTSTNQELPWQLTCIFPCHSSSHPPESWINPAGSRMYHLVRSNAAGF